MEESVIELERLAEADQQSAVSFGRRLPPLDDPGLEVRVHRALGNAHRALSELGAALTHYDAGVDLARRAGLTEAQSLIRMSRAGAFSIAGDRRRAMADLRHAERLASGPARARVLFQRAVVVQRFSEGADALAAYDSVIPVLERYDDQLFLAHAVANRGLLRTYQGDPEGAESDLGAALALYERLELPSPAAVVVHNLGLLRTRVLDLPGAMGYFDEAERRLQALDRPMAGLRVDRAESLIASGLVDDAMRLSSETVTDLESRGLLTDLAEALLIGAHASALLGDDGSRALARRAADQFDRQARPGWRDRAQLLELELALRQAAIEDGDAERARRLGRRLAARGLQGPAARAAVVEGGFALAAGRRRLARGCVQRAAWARRSGLLEDRLAYWQLRAAVRLADGDRANALAAARQGLRDLRLFQERLAAPDARTGITIHADRLITTGLRAARGSRRRDTLFRWMTETAEAFVDAQADSDDDLTVPLTELRNLAQELVDADEPERPRLLARTRSLEAEVQRRSRRRTRSPSTERRLDFDQLVGSIAGKRCLAFADIDGVMHRCDRGPDGRHRTAAIGETEDLARQVRSLQALFRRAAVRPTASTFDRLDQSCERLGAQLLDDLPTESADLVVLPRGPLALAPWTALPQLGGRPISVGFSLSSLGPHVTGGGRKGRRSHRNPSLTVVAGPRLDRSHDEAIEIASTVDDVEIIRPHEATAEAVLEALRRSSTVHFACHGLFRSDNPLFSHLELADGPLTVYDILSLKGPIAEEIILSSCSGAEVSSRPERAFIGMSGGFLAAGIRTIVASIAPVPDAPATHRLMADYHRRRRSGASPSAALQASRKALSDPAARWQASSFLTIGAGWGQWPPTTGGG